MPLPPRAGESGTQVEAGASASSSGRYGSGTATPCSVSTRSVRGTTPIPATTTSARSTMRVLALEMSSPVSTIVVQTSTSKRFSQKSSTTCS